MPKPPLTKKKYDWAKNRNTTLLGKTLYYNASIEQRYVRKLEKLVKRMHKDVTKNIMKFFKKGFSRKYFEDSSVQVQDDSISSQARILMNELTRKYEKLFNDESKNLADWMVDETLNYSKFSLHESLKQLSGGLSIKTGFITEDLEEVLKAIVTENVSLIRSIPDKYFTEVTGDVMRSITTGRGLADLRPQLQKRLGITERRARNIAIDQIHKTYTSINKERLERVGITQFRWVHSGGGQTPRKSHQKISGQTFSFADVEAEQAKLGVPPNDRGLPGYPINCFIGSTQISLANGCVNIWRYHHVGDVITIDVQGSSFTSTINHPILTHRGWLRADEIQEGDYLASSVLYDTNVIENKKTDSITTFENAFDSFEGVRSRESFGKFNFHGDIPETDVDRIAIANDLSCGFETIDSQQVEDFIFSMTNIKCYFSGLRFITEIFKSCFASRLGDVCPFFFGHPAHPEFCSFACSSQYDPVFVKNTADNLSTAFPIFTQLQNAGTEIITIDDIFKVRTNVDSFPCCGNDIPHSRFKGVAEMVSACSCSLTKIFKAHSPVKSFLRVNKKTVSKFSGHVYTMQSNNGWYSVSSAEVISKNCRCTYIPVIEFDD